MTITTSEGRLSIREIRDILKLCRREGVERLAVPGLKVSFGPADDRVKLRARPRKSGRIAQQDLVDQERSARRDQLDHMMVEEPMAYEELMATGDLERRAKEPDDSGAQ